MTELEEGKSYELIIRMKRGDVGEMKIVEVTEDIIYFKKYGILPLFLKKKKARPKNWFEGRGVREI